jgi:aspartate dehydrogenase
MQDRRVALIGFGAIGRELAALLQSALAEPVRIATLTRRRPAELGAVEWLAAAADLIAWRPELVVEAAGHGAVNAHVPPILGAGIPVVLASVGALADESLHARVREAARRGHTDLILPGGAVGGVDYIKSVAHLPDLQVRYCSRKPIAAWTKELAERGIDPAAASGEITLFEGSARDAALSFPQNLNVAMTLALAGAGMDATRVRVVADSRARGNTHEVDVESKAGRARLVFENSPSSSNPKTSALTALSILHAVRERLARVSSIPGAEP